MSKLPPLKTKEEIEQIENMKEDMKESFLDNVYGAYSKLLRKDYEAKVVMSEKWIFSSKLIRTHIEKAIKNKE